MPKGIKILGTAAIFVFTFLLFTYWMLPVDAAKQRVIAALEKELGSEYQVQIENFSTYRLTGASLKVVTIQKMVEGKPLTVFQADRLHVRVGLFSLLFRKPKISFDAKMDSARVRGFVQQQEEGYQIEAALRNLDVGKIPLVQLSSGLHLNSSIEGKIALFYNKKSPLRTEGDFTLTIQKLSLKKSTVPLGEMGTFPLPELDLAGSDSGLETKIEKGSMEVGSIRLTGKDLNLNLKGRVFLAPEVSKYRLSLQGTLQLSPKVWGVFDPILPEPLATNLKKQKGPSDQFPVNVSGQLSSPQVYCGAIKLYPFQPF